MSAIKEFVAAVAVCLALFVAGRFAHRSRVDTQLAQFHATEITPVPPVFEAWWDSAATCLGVAPKWNPKARFFLSDTIPPEMVLTVDAGRTFGGYADQTAQIAVFARGAPVTRAVLTHEVWHLHFGLIHPDATFKPPRCGLAAP